MGTNLIRAMLLASAGVAAAVVTMPTAAYAQEASYQIDIPAQSMGDALRALGKATKQNIVFKGSLVKGKRSAAVRGRMSAGEALDRMLQGSGLKMSRGSGGGLVVQAGNDVAAPARIEAPAISSSASASASTVVDARTGAALKGALVEIVETGEKTSTNDSGEFRFPGRNGSVNLRISYLGYPKYEQYVDLKDGRSTVGILLSDGSANGDIIVYASRSARAQSLNQERTADNMSTVVSTDDLGNFNGKTISESLRRIPGVAFQRDPINGDGNNIIIRGMQPDLNEVKLNGIALPETTGQLRSAALGNILTDSIEEITVSKTLLPSQDSSGAGGLIDIKTKSPLNRPRRYASLTLEGGLKPKGFGNDFFASATVSGKFGQDESFGASASVQYRRSKIRRFSYGTNLLYGEYLPLQIDGQPSIVFSNYIDPARQFPFEPGADGVYATSLQFSAGETRTDNLAMTFALEKQISNSTNLKLEYQRSVSDFENISRGTTIYSSSYYSLLPVNSLGGAERQAIFFDGNLYNAQTFVHLPSEKNQTDVLTFRGETILGRLKLNYLAGYARGRNRSAGQRYASFNNYTDTLLDPSFILPGAVDTVEGRVLTIFGPRAGSAAPLPLVTQGGFDMINDPTNYALTDSNITRPGGGHTNRVSAEASARYDTSSKWLDYIELGAAYEQSKFDNEAGTSTIYFGTATLPDLGLGLTESAFARAGIRSPLLVTPFTDVRSFFDSLPSLPDTSGGIVSSFDFARDPRQDAVGSKEEQFNAYVQTKLTFGKLEIIGGVRLDHTKFKGTIFYGADYFDENFARDVPFGIANLTVEDVTGSITEFLPRVAANLRFSENAILRFGYYASIARPELRQLGGGTRIQLTAAPFFGPSSNQPLLEVFEGNPDLKPARTHSLDVSAEIYSGSLGVLKLGAFYKLIKNPLEATVIEGTPNLEGVELPDDPRFQSLPANVFISYSRPVNGARSNKLWGIEATFERQLTFLPGALGGLGLLANYTYTDGKTDQQLSWTAPIVDAAGNVTGYETRIADFTNVPLYQQAPHTGTAAITYNKYGFDASFAYTYQSSRLISFQPFGLHLNNGSYETLDFKMEYRFMGGKMRAFFEANDLLRGVSDPDLLTRNGPYVTSGSYLGGRSFRAGISATF
jgi:TonB-dependent receptor